MYRQLSLSILLAAAMACTPAPEPAEEGPIDLTVSLEPPELGYQLASQPYIVAPHSEVYMCDVVRVDPQNGENLAWIGAIASRTSQSSHHMNVNMGIFSMGELLDEGLSETLLGVELGQHDCNDLGDLMADQQLRTVYPSQRTEQEGVLPKGVALPLPVPLVLIMEQQYINTGDQPVLANAVLNLHRIDEDEVEHVVSGVWGRIDDIVLPPNSRKIEAHTCRLTRDFTMFAISSHSHERGACFTMNFFLDGEIEEEPFFVNTDWESPPIFFMEQQERTNYQTMEFKKGDGIHWACHYVNSEDREVRTGPTADDEMCIFVAMGHPGDVTVEEVKEMFAAETLNTREILEALTAALPCEPVYDLESPWADANTAIPLDDDPYVACAGLPHTQ
jgi:hypothetical protein